MAKLTQHMGMYALIGLFLFITGCEGPIGPAGPEGAEGPAGMDAPPSSIAQLTSELKTLLRDASPTGELSYYRLPDSHEYDKIPQDSDNPITLAKVQLGKLLFHETGLAISPMNMELGPQTYSCASCHHSRAGFQAGRIQGIGEGGMGFGIRGEGRTNNVAQYDDLELDVQPIRTPTAMNTAFQTVMLWNGQFGAKGLNTGTEAFWTPDTPIADNHFGYEGLEIQAIAGLKVHRMEHTETSLIASHPKYIELFDRAFPDIAGTDRYNREYAGLAIAAYERTLLSNQAPFQQWLRGKSALGDDELRGALLFFGKAQCNTCHTGPALNSESFYALGMGDLKAINGVYGELHSTDEGANLGRGAFTGAQEDMYTFKVPQLYNLADVSHYGHGGTLRSLFDVVMYKNAGVPEKVVANLADAFLPLGLSDDEIYDLVAFLEKSLYDPNLHRYEPTQSQMPSGNCPIVNDPLSRLDLGCAPAPAQ